MHPDGSAAPPDPSTDPERRAGRWVGRWLALVAALLALVTAAGPVREAGVWSHLARGKALASGQPRPDRDPALLSPADPRAAHRSIPYDLALLAAYRLGGGAGVVALHAAVAAALALALFALGRGPARETPAALGTLLSVVAAAPWLELSPALFSCLFLALTMLLARGVARDAGAGRERWALLALIALWANVDRWVVLGPLVIGLASLGQYWWGERRAAQTLGRLFLLGLAASLLSPNHVEVWNPARTVGWEALALKSSPLWPAWYKSGPPAVGAAYLFLVLFGLAAFARNAGSARVWAPLWVGLLALALWTSAGAPFFAVVAGPVAAAGLAGLVAAGPRAEARRRHWSVRFARHAAGPLLAIAGAAVLVAGWGGWVTGPPRGRPTGSVRVDDSLRDAVIEVARQRKAGAFGPDARGLTLSPDVANYWSLFADGSPQPGGGDATPDVARVLAGIVGDAGAGAQSGGDWREVLRAHGVNHLILHAGEAAQAEPVVTRLGARPEEWSLLYLRGGTAVFGWRDPLGPAAGTRLSAARLDVERRAFRPSPEDLAPDGPAREPGARDWWRTLEEPLPVPSGDQSEAALYLAYFDGHRGAYELQNRSEWLALRHASLIGNLAMPVPAPAPVGVAVGSWAVGTPGDWPRFLSTRDDGPPGAALLAVRAARRAIRANPDDAKSYFLLGESYLRLAEATRERSWRYQLPAFDRIRQVQAITAFQNALTLRPDSPAAHGRLARLYRDRGSLDLALRHMDRLLAITQARGPQPGEKPEAARDAVAALQRDRDALAAEVRTRAAPLDEGKSGRRVLDLAREAAAVGLPGRALDILLKSDSSEFGPEGARLELDLLLWAGRARDVRNWLDEGLERNMGAVTYREIAACLAAATGDYRDAVRQMRGVASALLRAPSRLPTPRAQASYDVTRALLATQFVGGNPGAEMHQFMVRQGVIVEVEQIASSLGREANALVVAGLLALEAGEVAEAESLLAQALDRWQGRDGAVHGGRIDFAGRTVAQDCLGLIARHRGP